MTALTNILGLGLLLCIAAGAIIGISMLSVARTVAMYKHPDWTFKAAFDHVYLRSLIGLAILAVAMAAIWVILPWTPQLVLRDDLLPGQIMATAVIIVAGNLHYYYFVVEAICRPPK